MLGLVLVSLAIVSAEALGPVSPVAGNFFEVLIDRFEIIAEDTSYMEWHLKVRKVNKTRMLVGYVDLKVPVGNDYMFEGKMLKKQGNEYRYQPYGIPKKEVCTFHAQDKYIYPDLAKFSDLPEDVDANCPLQPGNYTSKGFEFTLENVPKAILPSGDYAVEWIYTNSQDEAVGKYRIYGQINQV